MNAYILHLPTNGILRYGERDKLYKWYTEIMLKLPSHKEYILDNDGIVPIEYREMWFAIPYNMDNMTEYLIDMTWITLLRDTEADLFEFIEGDCEYV